MVTAYYTGGLLCQEGHLAHLLTVNWLNEKKIPLEQVQLMAGHKWISSTLKYRQNDTDEQREMMNKWFPI